jgi:peptidoglycan/LPS O-acetylase OafA/YrhL
VSVACFDVAFDVIRALIRKANFLFKGITAHLKMLSNSTSAQSQIRPDIQILRGMAVLLVVIHHSNLLQPLQSGYLGVDIFFVISGFLITKMIASSLQFGSFRFREFYFRRAKRLLPSAYVTLFLTALAAPWFLTSVEMRDFFAQLFGALTFNANHVLWRQTGYFEGSANLKPLLHVWSLSIEEQFYFFLPFALAFTPPDLWKRLIFGITVTSMAVCFLLLPYKPGAVFYLLPTRAWELGLGSVGAIVTTTPALESTLQKLFWPSVAAIAIIPLFPLGGGHPGLDALVVCTATLIVILRQHPIWANRVILYPMIWLGGISYSLYLVHWPILAFAANSWVSPIPGAIRLFLVLAGLLLSVFLYHNIERPFRNQQIKPTVWSVAAIITATISIFVFASALQLVDGSTDTGDYAYRRRANVGLNAACEYSDVFLPKPECQTSADPKIMIWGDSYAMHWVEGIKETAKDGIIQATRTTCGPVLDISMFNSSGSYSLGWAKKCIDFNRDVASYLAKHPSIKFVVLASLFQQYLDGSQVLVKEEGAYSGADELFRETHGSQELAFHSLSRTVSLLRSLGKKVIIMAPPPSGGGIDFARCIERKETRRVFFGSYLPTCDLPAALYFDGRKPVNDLLERVHNNSDVEVFSIDSFLCNSQVCAVTRDGRLIYRDNGHLSYEGSSLLGEKLNLADKIVELAK